MRTSCFECRPVEALRFFEAARGFQTRCWGRSSSYLWRKH